jgi:hypothetical protein
LPEQRLDPGEDKRSPGERCEQRQPGHLHPRRQSSELSFEEIEIVGDARADTRTTGGRLMLTVLGGLAEFERELIRAHNSEGCERQSGRTKPRLKARAYPGARRSFAPQPRNPGNAG